jgi:CyaY protein
MLDEHTYDALVSRAFKRIVAALDGAEPDLLEADFTGEMVTITASGGEKVVVNTQRAVRQLWVAGQGQGIHFSWDASDQKWKDDKGRGLELFRWLEECVQAACGSFVPLTPP